MTQQTLADWLAADNRITICPQCGARSQAERDRSTATAAAFSVADGRRSLCERVTGAG
jgi:hypothetical protein